MNRKNQQIKYLTQLSATETAKISGGAAFVKYEGIDGESKDSNHDKWIDVLSVDWGIHKPGGGS